MAWVFPVFLVGWPAIEIAAFVEVARWVGLFWAIAGIAASSALGLALLRVQGISTMRRAEVQLASGRMPVGELFDGACLAVAGLLFLVPGFVGDIAGAALLLPPIRFLLRALVVARLHVSVVEPGRTAAGGSSVIDGEWEVVRDKSETDGRADPPRLPPIR
jgi:UPF0716 protein FxsA